MTHAPPLPCPFCGGEAQVDDWDDEFLEYGDVVRYVDVSCETCGISFTSDKGQADAINRWNTRATNASPGEPATLADFQAFVENKLNIAIAKKIIGDKLAVQQAERLWRTQEAIAAFLHEMAQQPGSMSCMPDSKG